MVDDNTISTLKQLLGSDDRVTLLKTAEICQSLTIPQLIPELIKLTSYPNNDIARYCLISLINITSNFPVCINELIASNAVKRLLESVIEPLPNNVNYRLMLLTNLTTETLGARQLLDIDDPDIKGQKLLRLAVNFCLPPNDLAIAQTEEINGLPIKATITTYDHYEYAAMVLMNATMIKEGREVFYENPKFFMPAFLECMYSSNKIRKQGIIGVIRNLCFDHSKHQFLIEQCNVLRHIIKPLVPPQLENNVTAYEMLTSAFPGLKVVGLEPLASNRRCLLETVLQLCQSEYGREQLIKKHVVFTIREVYELETDEENKELTLRIGSLLLPPEELEKPVNNDDLS